MSGADGLGPVVWDSHDVDEGYRQAAIRSMLRERLADVRLATAVSGASTGARVTCWSLGPAQVVVAAGGPTVVERRREAVTAGCGHTLFVVLPHGTRSVVRRGDRELVVRPGDLVVYDNGAPFAHEFPDGIDVDVFTFPVERLGLAPTAVDAVAAMNLVELTPLARIVRNLFADLAAHPPSSTSESSVAGPAADLLRAMLEAAARHVAPVRRDRLVDTILAFVITNLADPDLDAQMIARRHHISERHLYAVLARAGIHLSRFILQRRLHDVGVALTSPSVADVPIGVLARRHGFVSASHFSRRFREQYGTTPREWRHKGLHSSVSVIDSAARLFV